MPELSRFFGIVVKMIFKDNNQHHKPHVHVYFNEYEASIGIDGELLAGSIHPLAQIAARRRQYRTVANLTRDFAEKYPAHPHLVDNQYLAALAHAGEAAKALPLLEELYAHYPQHHRAPQIARLLAELKNAPPPENIP